MTISQAIKILNAPTRAAELDSIEASGYNGLIGKAARDHADEDARKVAVEAMISLLIMEDDIK